MINFIQLIRNIWADEMLIEFQARTEDESRFVIVGRIV